MKSCVGVKVEGNDMRDNSAYRGVGSMKTLLNRLDADAAGPGNERHKRPEDRDPLGALRAIDLKVIAAAAANDDQSIAGRSVEPNLAELRAFLAQAKSGEAVGEAPGGNGGDVPDVAAFNAFAEGYSQDLPGPHDDDLPKVVASGPVPGSEPAAHAEDGAVLKPVNRNEVVVRTITSQHGFARRAFRPLKLAVAASLPLCLGVAYVSAGWFASEDLRTLRDVPAVAATAPSGGLAVASSAGFDLAALVPSALEPRGAGDVGANGSNAASNAGTAAGNVSGEVSGEVSGSAPASPGGAALPINSSVVTDANGKRRILVDAQAGERIALPVELGPASATAEVGALVVRGLPDSFSITGASAAGDGSWVLAPQELQTARIIVPEQAAGEVDVAISLFDFAAVEVGLMNLRLKIAARTVKAGASASTSGGGLQTSAQSLDPDRARGLLERGRQLLEIGDVAAARLLFERAAEGGVAEAALLAGETYDPVRLAMRGVVGLRGSAETAKGWYERALAQGVNDAHGPLAVLAAFEAREKQP